MSQRTQTRSIAGTPGFTLVELVVTLAVLAILAAIAMPSMTGMASNSRLKGQAEEMAATLQLARSEAVRRNTSITLCPTNGSNTIATVCSGSTAWANWAILDLSKTSGPAEDRVLRVGTPSGGVQISGPAAGIVFRPSGMIAAQQVVTVCMPVSDPPDNQRVLTVMISGVIAKSYANGGGACP